MLRAFLKSNLRPTALRGAAVGTAALAPALLQAPQPSRCAAASDTPIGLPLPAGFPEITYLQAELATVSGFAGYTAAFAIKRTFRVFLFTSGVIFMGLKVLEHNELITINWDKMDEKFKVALDQDGNGTLDFKDLRTASDHTQAYLAAGLPSGAGFSAGFLFGLRS